MKTIDVLDSDANKLYDMEATDEQFKNFFSREELVALWKERCIYREENGRLVDVAPYDDEVYNALDRLGYWDNK